MGFSRQEYQSGLPCPPPGDLPNSGIKPALLTSPTLAGGFFTISITWEAQVYIYCWIKQMSNYTGVIRRHSFQHAGKVNIYAKLKKQKLYSPKFISIQWNYPGTFLEQTHMFSLKRIFYFLALPTKKAWRSRPISL